MQSEPGEGVKFAAEYDQVQERLKRLCQQVKSQIEDLVRQEGISLGFPIQHRVKEWHSLQQKLSQNKLHIKKILDVQDLAGVRVIVLFQRDATRLGELLEKHFKLRRKYNTQERLSSDQFGYNAMHYIIEVPDEWRKVPTFAGLEGLKTEVQIRTVAQHLWAELSQNFQYKREDSVPQSIQRSIHRVSALLETVDLEFERLLQERDMYRKTANAPEAPEDESLNIDMLEKLLDKFFPETHKEENEDYDQLYLNLLMAGVTTRAGLVDLLSRYRDKVLAVDAEFVNKIREAIEEYEDIDIIAWENSESDTYVVDEVDNYFLIVLCSELHPRGGGNIAVSRDEKDKLDKGVFYSHVSLGSIALEFFKENELNERADKQNLN